MPKPCDVELLKARLRYQLMILETESLPREPARDAHQILVGASPGMETLHALITQFADTPFPVLIEGESSSSKELAAERLHSASEHCTEPMLTINCAAFTPELLVAQLFGHAKGAFTGADKTRPGFFEEADRGTLFLDEVSEMPLDLQSELLRVLENGEYYRIGETEPRQSKMRVIAASNRDLRESARAGGFRPDLFHRLSVLTVGVPSLRSRNGDWRLLVDAFQHQYADTIKPFTLSAAACGLLDDYAFSG